MQYLYGNPDDPFQVTAARSSGGELTQLFYNESGLLIALERGGNRFYVATDHVGTPKVVTEAGGTPVKRLEYDSFGNETADTNPGFELPLGFAGGLPDEATGLVRFGFRDYDPQAGRWTAKDPIGFAAGPNVYAYTDSNPVTFRDPTGLDDELDELVPRREAKAAVARPLSGSPNKGMPSASVLAHYI